MPKTPRMVAVESVDWDDRKQIREVFQDAAAGRLTVEGPTEAEYDALIAVARWGAEQAAGYSTFEE